MSPTTLLHLVLFLISSTPSTYAHSPLLDNNPEDANVFLRAGDFVNGVTESFISLRLNVARFVEHLTEFDGKVERFFILATSKAAAHPLLTPSEKSEVIEEIETKKRHVTLKVMHPASRLGTVCKAVGCSVNLPHHRTMRNMRRHETALDHFNRHLSRRRRGPVGWVAAVLSGIAIAEATANAAEISKLREVVEGDQKLFDQIVVSFDAVQHNADAMAAHLGRLTKTVKRVITKEEEQDLLTRVYEETELLADKADAFDSILARIEGIVLDAIAGKLNPHLLTKDMRDAVFANVTAAAKARGMNTHYNNSDGLLLSKVTAGFSGDYLRLIVHVGLVGKAYPILRHINVPLRLRHQEEDALLSLELDKNLRLVMDSTIGRSLEFPESDLALCDRQGARHYCNQMTDWRPTNQTCLGSLYFGLRDDLAAKCTFMASNQSIFHDRIGTDEYAVYAARTKTVSRTCANHTDTFEVTGYKILTVPTSCSLSAENFYITAQGRAELVEDFELRPSLPHLNETLLRSHVNITPFRWLELLGEMPVFVKPDLAKLGKLVQDRHDLLETTHWTRLIIGVIATVCGLAIIVWAICRCRRKNRAAAEDAPTADVEYHRTGDSSVVVVRTPRSTSTPYRSSPSRRESSSSPPRASTPRRHQHPELRRRRIVDEIQDYAASVSDPVGDKRYPILDRFAAAAASLSKGPPARFATSVGAALDSHGETDAANTDASPSSFTDDSLLSTAEAATTAQVVEELLSGQEEAQPPDVAAAALGVPGPGTSEGRNLTAALMALNASQPGRDYFKADNVRGLQALVAANTYTCPIDVDDEEIC